MMNGEASSWLGELIQRVQLLFESYPAWMVIAVSLILALFVSLIFGRILKFGLGIIIFILALAGVLVGLSYLIEIVPAS